MKKQIFLLSILLCSSISISAQLRVESSGKVKMSKNVAINGANITDSVSLNIFTPQAATGMRKYGIHSVQEVSIPLTGAGCNAAIVGQINLSANNPHYLSPKIVNYKFNAGVAGIAATGIGVYGSTTPSLPTSWPLGTYAGYFNGNVRVSGTLSATTVTTTSDSRLKENISKLGSEYSSTILSRLNPVSFAFRNDSSIYLEEKKSAIHYGFIAQEMKEILPELVYEDGAGYLSINYIELIPLLVQTINQQQIQIKELTQRVQKIESGKDASVNRIQQRSNNGPMSENAILYQNNPNPFTVDTKIEYELPITTRIAMLYIYNMSGIQVSEYPISVFGKGSVIVSANALDAGMYLYSETIFFHLLYDLFMHNSY